MDRVLQIQVKKRSFGRIWKFWQKGIKKETPVPICRKDKGRDTEVNGAEARSLSG